MWKHESLLAKAHDVMGKAVKQGEMEKTEINISMGKLAAGVYYLRMRSPEGKQYLLKVVKR